jgi:hypothetical protein
MEPSVFVEAPNIISIDSFGVHQLKGLKYATGRNSPFPVCSFYGLYSSASRYTTLALNKILRLESKKNVIFETA